jgi:4-hydroxy-tetrahydrodipicolinate reductase
MGQKLILAAHHHPRLRLAGALISPQSEYISQDIGNLTGLGLIGVETLGDFQKAAAESSVYIDFTNPEAVISHIEKAEKLGLAAVIGVTGLKDSQIERLKVASLKIPVLWSPNMSLGVNLMYKIASMMAKSLGPDFDIEIVETHHRLKKDAPSGTALKLYESLCQARGLDPKTSLRSGRQGLVGPRTEEEIGVLAVRGGDIVGDHSVFFAGLGERLELIHRSHSRDNFAAGAIRAAVWIYGQKPGYYSLSDALGL